MIITLIKVREYTDNMPYEIRGKCIYRKDTGAKVGCTKGDVHKYMAALLANTHEGETLYEIDVDLNESTKFLDGVPYGYGFDTSTLPSKIFEDKSGQKYIIFVHESGGSSRQYYTIVVKTLGEQVDRKDRYGRTGSYLGGENVGVLWLEECEDGVYRSTPTLSDGLWVREDKRRQGIATAMHDYANKVLGLKTDISTVASQDAQSFWKNRNSNLSEEEIVVPDIPNTMTFWHGGNLDDYSDIIAQKNGRYEWGAGLYLITKYDVAAKYARGSRKLYIVTVEKGVDINDAFIDIDKAKQFVDTYVIKHLRKQIWERISNPKFVVDGKIVAYAFNNIILNEKAIKSTNTQYLRAFYVNNGIDYEIVDNPFGWGEKMMVLYNMNKIVNTTQIKPGDKISDYNMLDKQGNLNEVVAGEDEENTEMISGIIDLLCQVKDMNNRKKMVIDQIKGLKGEGIDINEKEFARRCGFSDDILDESNEYAGEHEAPDKESGAPLYNLTSMYPEDIYGPDAVRMYGDNGDSKDVESISIIKSARNKPNAIIVIYRAVPDINKDVKAKVTQLYDIVNYYNKFGFFPPKTKLVWDLQDKYDIEKYGYEKQQQLIFDDIYSQAEELSKQLLPGLKINKGDWVTINKQYAKEHGQDNLRNSYKILTKRVLAKQLFTDGNNIHEWGYDF